MKLTHHKDGTFSITGMTRRDVSNIDFGMVSAEAWYATNQPSGYHDRDAEWHATQVKVYETLRRATHTLAESREKGSLVLSTDENDQTYTTESVRGLRSWSES